MATTKAYPPGGTYFDNGKRSFTQVSVDESKGDAVNTVEFLEASEALVGLFDVLGSVAFTPVKNDITGNIKKVRDRQLASPLESETLQDLVRNELKTKKHTATEGLVWLLRGLDFTSQGLRKNLSNPSAELSTSFREAYTATLSKFHSFLIKPIFSAAMSATPARADFYAKLGDDQERVKKELDEWLKALEIRVAILTKFLNSPEAKW
ncbi:glycolipid transfer protein HET-C2 [Dissoconium aciculare CBS 342.82]|uniref:Glycolipid transfer protein HET-C2 n=1 Tax=Dissoconium aciculare CBS 342.82 TaxID=1314786 RepID=A0A6J3MHN2_9PEZI|nr:glycolipid transfer protein HET-C2 [Dissoconium aciculare CBS 342.82]KAF1827445.1 glycolipid transfer protein HET-C2 [Dissoconium aciculare CBS 342.82]